VGKEGVFIPNLNLISAKSYSLLRSAVALRPAKSGKFDRATRDIIRDIPTTLVVRSLTDLSGKHQFQ
jgi:hypothetical protein